MRQIPHPFLAQFLSLFIASSAFCSESLSRYYGVSIPTTQSSLVYLGLSMHVCFLIRKNSGGRDEEGKHYFPGTSIPLSVPYYIYIIIALLDVEANYLIVSAFRYTSITSIALIDCTSIPFVMLFSIPILRVVYNRRQILSALVCLVGLGIIVYADSNKNNAASESSASEKPSSESSSESTNGDSIKGDLLCLAGASLYALNNVLAEKFCKTNSRVEYLSFLGLFGTIISAVQIFFTEKDDFVHFFVHATWPAVLLTLAYVISIISFYIGVSLFLQYNSAALLNISLLTSDVYATLFQVFVEKFNPSILYFVAFVIIVFGVVSFNKEENKDGNDGVSNEEDDSDGGNRIHDKRSDSV